MQSTKEEIETILVSMGLEQIAFNLPIKKQIDSMDMTTLIIAVEDQWQISITDEDQEELATFDDLIKLIHLKTADRIPSFYNGTSPTIDDQIDFMDKIRPWFREQLPKTEQMIKAIKENLIAIRMIRQSAQIETALGNKDISGAHSFTEGHDL